MEREYKRSRRRVNTNDSAETFFMRTFRRSILSMLLCTVCLISSTWAWFVVSAESQVSVIRMNQATLTVTQEYRTFSRRSSVRQVDDGEFMMAAGTYIISVEPNSGSAPMYCLVEIETENTADELAELALEEFNADMDEEWIPIYATGSNALLLLEDDEELEDYTEKLEETYEDFEYEILLFSVMMDGTYRVDWEPEEERTFTLVLEQDAIVKMEVFWLTEDETEDDHPGLDEMTGWNYIIVYPERTASPVDAERAQSTLTTVDPTLESSAAATEGSPAASEPSSEAVTEPSSETNSATGTETGSEMNTETSTEAASEANTETVENFDTESSSEAVPETNTPINTDTGTGVTTEAGTTGTTETGTEASTGAGTESATVGHSEASTEGTTGEDTGESTELLFENAYVVPSEDNHAEGATDNSSDTGE